MVNIEFSLLVILIFGIAAIAAYFILHDPKHVQHAFVKAKNPDVSPLHLVRSDDEKFPPTLIDRPLLELPEDTPINIRLKAFLFFIHWRPIPVHY